MNIIPSHALKAWDQATMKSQGISSLDLMERAANLLTKHLMKYLNLTFSEKIAVLCGIGNNGGDGLVMAKYLTHLDIEIEVYIFHFSNKYSDDFIINLENCKTLNLKIHDVYQENGIPDLEKYDVIIDAIFGYGLSKEMPSWIIRAFNIWNENSLNIIAIDVPSGLFLAEETEVALIPKHILTIQQPKISFFLPKNYEFVPSFEVVDIGLDETFFEQSDSEDYLISAEMIQRIYKPKSLFSHKGTNGHLLIVGGSIGKIGAVHLAAKAGFKSGCGLVSAWVPKCGVLPLQTNFPELMVIQNKGKNYFETEDLPLKTDAIVFGMGWADQAITEDALYHVLHQINQPAVFDADALNILAFNKEWLHLLPDESILTPHPKELERLIGVYDNDFERLEAVKKFSKKYDVVIVMKNARTQIVYLDFTFHYPEANPKLSKAGSGDVLAGIIGSFFAQGYESLNAAILGVYLHAQSAKMQKEISVESFIASDIFNGLNKVFLNIPHVLNRGL